MKLYISLNCLPKNIIPNLVNIAVQTASDYLFEESALYIDNYIKLKFLSGYSSSIDAKPPSNKKRRHNNGEIKGDELGHNKFFELNTQVKNKNVSNIKLTPFLSKMMKAFFVLEVEDLKTLNIKDPSFSNINSLWPCIVIMIMQYCSIHSK